jgi:LacI family transcriptional regulator
LHFLYFIQGVVVAHMVRGSDTEGSTQEEYTASPDRQPVVTIYDVARAAGVTIGTVSKALNGQGKLRQETRARVQEVAARLGFQPNSLAQSLLRGRSFTVGLLTTDRYGRFSIPLLSGIEDALGESQVSVFLCNTFDNPVRERQHIESLLAKHVDGIIVTGRRTDPRPPIALDSKRAPVLYAYTQVADPGALCLLPDDEQGARLAGEHLVSHGRRRLAHITGPGYFAAVQERIEGMRAVLRQHGLECPEHRILAGPWSEAWGYQAVNNLLDSDSTIDAIFCGSDQLARGAADALRERGVRVPDDIALVGFDNWEVIAAATRPPLTTIDMNLHELGRQAGIRLLDLVNGKKETGIIRLPCSLVLRASCGVHTQEPDRLEDTEPILPDS